MSGPLKPFATDRELAVMRDLARGLDPCARGPVVKARTRHSFGAPDRHGVQRCKLCGLLRRTVYAASSGRIGAQLLLYRDPSKGLWSDWNPGCSKPPESRLEIVWLGGASAADWASRGSE